MGYQSARGKHALSSIFAHSGHTSSGVAINAALAASAVDLQTIGAVAAPAGTLWRTTVLCYFDAAR